MDEVVGITVKVNGIDREIKNVKDYKQALVDLQKTADSADFGSDAAKEAGVEMDKLKGKMAEINTQTKVVDNSISGLKTRFKELKVELSNATNPEDFKRLSAELNEVEGKIGDMNDAAAAASGSGIEQLSKGVGLVREGLFNFDFDKIKIGFKAIGNAMSAAAPFLLIEAIKLLVENFDKVVDAVKTITGAYSQQEKAVKSLTKELEAQKQISSILTSQYQNQIALLEAQGASEQKIMDTKRKLYQVQLKELEITLALNEAKLNQAAADETMVESSLRATAAILRQAGETEKADQAEKIILNSKKARLKDEIAAVQQSRNALEKLKTDYEISQINSDKKVAESNKKRQQELEAQGEENAKKEKERRDKRQQELEAQLAEENMIFPQAKQEQIQSLEEIQAAADAKALSDSALKAQAEIDEEKRINAEKLASRKQFYEETDKLATASFAAGQALSDALFSIQLNNAEKGSAKEKEIRKKQFEVDKAFSVARVIQDGIRSVQANLALGPPGIPLAVLAGITAAANVTKILATKFDGGGSGSGAISTGAPTGNIDLPGPPVILPPQQNTSTQFDNQGNNLNTSQQQVQQGPIKAYVVETEISDSQRQVQRLKNQATW